MRVLPAVFCSVLLASGCIVVDSSGDSDNDNDGIVNSLDDCPNQPETVNGYLDQDGCPDINPVVGVRTPPSPSSYSTQYGVKPGAGLSFEGAEWGYAVTADGTGGWTLSFVGNPDLSQNRFFGTAYVGTGTVGSVQACQTCQAAGTSSVSATRIDFDATLSGAALAGFTFVHDRNSASDPIYLDLYVDGYQSGVWKIYFVSTDTNSVGTSPENPVALVSP